MTRKEFLILMSGMGVSALTASASALVKTPSVFRARRTVTEYIGELNAPAEFVFPLLCPVREYEWLDGWKGKMVYSNSGAAEENCIFTTSPGPCIWNTDCYEPPKRIAFTVISPEQVSRINLTLDRTASGGTKLKWQRTFTGLNDAGNAKVDSWKTDTDRLLTQALDYFLMTGKMAHGT
jgi:hypothetical protein